MLFNEHLRTIHHVSLSVEELREEPQFFRASPEFVWHHSPRTYSIIEEIFSVQRPLPEQHVSVDTRIHMLFPGFWPCIPGWHCDDFYRPGGILPANDFVQCDKLGMEVQPDLIHAPKLDHFCVVIGETSMPEFVNERMDLPVPFPPDRKDDEPIYGAYNRLLDKINDPPLKIHKLTSGEVVYFDQLCFHRGTRATKRSWRFFFRMTYSNHHKAEDKIRTQSQVYLEIPLRGW